MTDQLTLDIPDDTGIQKSAVISDDGVYRYELRRWWSDGPLLEWVMLNPSTADANVDDPTIKRCIGFAKDWGFAGIRVCNLFALRSADPDLIATTTLDAIGPKNGSYLMEEHGPLTVCGWGAHPTVEKRWATSAWASILVSRSALICVGYNKDGSPKHPLYVAKTAAARPWPKPLPSERHYT